MATSRVIKSWAFLYDWVSFFVYLMFGGTKRLYRDIISMPPVEGSEKILDIGCGTGEFLLELAKIYPDITAYGIDASEEMLEIARKKAVSGKYHRLHFELAGAESLPFEDESFDCVFNTFLLHHLPMESKLMCLREVYRVLKAGKPFILVDVDKPASLLGKFIGMTRYSVKEIRENMRQPLAGLLAKAGFSAIELIRRDYGIFSFIRCRK